MNSELFAVMKITVLMQFKCYLYSEIRFKKSNQSPNLPLVLLFEITWSFSRWHVVFFNIVPRQELDGDWKTARIIPMLGNIMLMENLPTSHPVALLRSTSLMKVSSCLLFVIVYNICNIAVHWRTFQGSLSFCIHFGIWSGYAFLGGEEVSDKGEEETEWQQWVICLTNTHGWAASCFCIPIRIVWDV